MYVCVCVSTMQIKYTQHNILQSNLMSDFGWTTKIYVLPWVTNKNQAIFQTDAFFANNNFESLSMGIYGGYEYVLVCW